MLPTQRRNPRVMDLCPGNAATSEQRAQCRPVHCRLEPKAPASAIRARHPPGRGPEPRVWAARRSGDASQWQGAHAGTAVKWPRSPDRRPAPPCAGRRFREMANPMGEILLWICCRCSDERSTMQFSIVVRDNRGRRLVVSTAARRYPSLLRKAGSRAMLEPRGFRFRENMGNPMILRESSSVRLEGRPL